MKVSLKAMRVNRNLTRDEAAARIGVNPATLTNWENNETSMRASKIPIILKVYDCTIDDIILPVEST